MLGALLGIGSLFARLGSLITTAFTTAAGWAMRNPAAAAIVGLMLACGVMVWRCDRLAADAKQARTDQAQAEAALKVEQASNARLAASIAAQNAAVAALGTDSAQAVAQGKTALNAALARSATRAAASAQIAVPAASPVQVDCRTPDDVMVVKGKL